MNLGPKNDEMDEKNITLVRPMPLLWASSQVVPSADENALVARDMGNGLSVTYALVEDGKTLGADGEEGEFLYLREKEFPKFRMTRDDLHARAIENLTDVVKVCPPVWVQQGAIFVGLWAAKGHWSEAALLLVDELWDKTFKAHAPDGFIAAIPRPDVLAFCNSGDAAGLVELRAIVKQAFHSVSITKALFRRNGLSWHRYSD